MTPLLLGLSLALAGAAVDPNAPAAPPPRPAQAESPLDAAGDEPMLLPAAALCARGEENLQSGPRPALLHARALFRLATEWSPSNPCGHAGLARAIASIYLRGVEEDDALVAEALAASRRAVDLAPGSAGSLAAVASAQLADLRVEEARDTARKALAKDPDSLPALQILAQVSAASGRHERGLEAIRRAIDLRPDSSISRQVLGNLQLLSGDIAGAIQSYRGALALAGDFAPALMQLAAAYEQAGDLRESGRLFEKILADHPEESSRCHLYMGWSLMKRNSWRAALGAFEKVSFRTRRGLCDGTVVFLRGLCHAQIGNVEAARSAFREVIEKWPDATGGLGRPERLMSQAYEELARIALKTEAADAAGILEEGTSRPDAGPELSLRLARLYIDYHLPEKSAGLLEKAVRAPLTPRSAEPILAAGLEWARLARAGGDRAALDRLSAILEGHTEAIAELSDYVLELQAARVFSIAGRGDSALKCLRRAAAAGYTQFGWIESDAEMESLRKSQGYRDLVRSASAGEHPTN